MARRLHLTRLNWDREDRPGPSEYFPGDRCPTQCVTADGKPGIIVVYCTVNEATAIVRYTHCNCCGFLPENKLSEPRRKTSEVPTNT